jgi:hypothetical protein
MGEAPAPTFAGASLAVKASNATTIKILSDGFMKRTSN